MNVAQTTVVQDAWARGQSLTLHGWVYGLSDGLLQGPVDDGRLQRQALDTVYRAAVDGVAARHCRLNQPDARHPVSRHVSPAPGLAPGLRHRQGDDGRLQPALPAVSHRVGARQTPV